MVSILIQIAFFLLIVPAYYGLSIAVPWALVMPIRLAIGLVPLARRWLEQRVHIEFVCWKLIILTFLIVFLPIHFWLRLGDEPFCQLWKNPLLMAALYAFGIFTSFLIGASNPFLRRMSGSGVVLLIPIVLLVFFGYLFPSHIGANVSQWAMATGIVVAMFDQAYVLYQWPSQILQLQTSEIDLNELQGRIDYLAFVSVVVGEQALGVEFDRNIHYAQTRANTAYEKFSTSDIDGFRRDLLLAQAATENLELMVDMRVEAEDDLLGGLKSQMQSPSAKLSKKTSLGVRYPRHARGRLFRRFSTSRT